MADIKEFEKKTNDIIKGNSVIGIAYLWMENGWLRRIAYFADLDKKKVNADVDLYWSKTEDCDELRAYHSLCDRLYIEDDDVVFIEVSSNSERHHFYAFADNKNKNKCEEVWGLSTFIGTKFPDTDITYRLNRNAKDVMLNSMDDFALKDIGHLFTVPPCENVYREIFDNTNEEVEWVKVEDRSGCRLEKDS